MYEAFSSRLPPDTNLDIRTLCFFADAIPHKVWIADAHGEPIYVNKRWSDYTGFTLEVAKKQGWRSIFHPDDYVPVQRAWQASWQTGTNLDITVRIKRYDGIYLWHKIRASAQRNSEGQVWLWVGTTTDIDEQQKAEQALNASEENFRVLAETVPQMVWCDAADGSMVYCNQRYLDYIHATFEEAQGYGWHHSLHPDEAEQIFARLRQSLATGGLYEVEHRFRNGRTGGYRWFLTRALPVYDETGQIVKWFGTTTDIHEKKQTEEALRESEQRFRSLMDSNLLGIAISKEGIVCEANDVFLSLLGYNRKELTAGRILWTEITPPDYQEISMRAKEEAMITGVLKPYEKEYLTRDGRRVPVLLGGTVFRRHPRSLLAFIFDLSAQKEVERQKDFFMAMTGHELKTPITALKGMLQLIQRRVKQRLTQAEALPPDLHGFMADLLEWLTSTARQVDMQAHLINDLLDFSHIATNTLKLDVEPCDLVALVRETVEELRVTAPERSLLLILPEGSSAPVLVDRDRIKQVITNYVTNAIRYAPADQPIQIGLSVQPQTARVWVRDKGPGLTKEAQQEVWQRFRQIKGIDAQRGSGKGLGLGLYLCQMLIAQHQGEVGVESTPGNGSTFWFQLPLLM
jgi:PAS domain S-box-containing protein